MYMGAALCAYGSNFGWSQNGEKCCRFDHSGFVSFFEITIRGLGQDWIGVKFAFDFELMGYGGIFWDNNGSNYYMITNCWIIMGRLWDIMNVNGYSG